MASSGLAHLKHLLKNDLSGGPSGKLVATIHLRIMSITISCKHYGINSSDGWRLFH